VRCLWDTTILSAYLKRRETVIDIAAILWADLQRIGQPIEENDILIAATALYHDLPLATRNLAHFNRVPGLALDDWTQP
jgi:tRNA(fMet)-specific endonuclease VapC